MSAAPLLVEETAVSEFSEESPTSDYLEELPETPTVPARPAATTPDVVVKPERIVKGHTRASGGFTMGKVKRLPPQQLPYDPKVRSGLGRTEAGNGDRDDNCWDGTFMYLPAG